LITTRGTFIGGRQKYRYRKRLAIPDRHGGLFHPFGIAGRRATAVMPLRSAEATAAAAVADARTDYSYDVAGKQPIRDRVLPEIRQRRSYAAGLFNPGHVGAARFEV